MEKNCCFMDTVCAVYNDLVDIGMERVRESSVWDIGILKLCLTCLGIILGLSFTKFFKKIAPLVTITFIASYLYLMWVYFFAPEVEWED